MAVRSAGMPLESEAPRTGGKMDRTASETCQAAVDGFCHTASQLAPKLRERVRNLEAIVFEPAGVFYDATLWSRWLLALLARMGWRSGFRAFAQLLRGDCLHDVYCGRLDRPTALRKFLKGLGLNCGQAEEVLAASTAWRRELDNSLRPLPGVRKAVMLLRQTGVKLAVLADTEESADGMRERLAALGLAEEFDSVVASPDIGCTKPDSRAYRAVQQAVQVEPHKIAFVGQDGNDLAGAGKVGWLRIACHHDPSVEADVHLARLEDLAGLIQASRTLAAAG